MPVRVHHSQKLTITGLSYAGTCPVALPSRWPTARPTTRHPSKIKQGVPLIPKHECSHGRPTARTHAPRISNRLEHATHPQCPLA
ncbi:hypothetical protein BD779DRAFT_1495136 [Infundibulicybe gibba]|nr:hypothetical protein BD779DRAFT_1589684 [Infundibulicybe gibba]KAF8896311.1 hypothetical protein BD779DRAFT_1495136 [Infundibulicybe gibba]